MTQRFFWFLILVGLIIGTLSAATAAPPASVGQVAPLRPNIILIVADDQRWDTLDVMPTVQNRLMAEGVTFSQAFASNPQCCPSRASLLTGLYAHNHGVLMNRGAFGGYGAMDHGTTIARALRHYAGYETALFGKYLNGYEQQGTHIPPGWSEWQALSASFDIEYRKYFNYYLNNNGTAETYGAAPEDYSTDVLSGKIVDYLLTPRQDPFFLYFPVYAPHAPFVPAPRHAGAFDGIAPYRPPNYDEADISDKPAWVAQQPPLDGAAIDALRQGQLETLLAVDDAIAAMLQALETSGQLNNTVIIYTSDHGYLWGEHRGEGKNCPYEGCIRVPLVVWYPPYTDGSTRDALVLNVDIPVTIADLVNLPLPGAYEPDGDSLLPLLQNPAAAWRDTILLEHYQQPDLGRVDANIEAENLASLIPDFGAVRTAEWKYVLYETGEAELYDLVADPYELENVVDEPANADIVALLAARLDALWPGPIDTHGTRPATAPAMHPTP